MPVVGLNFNKIAVEKYKAIDGKIKINNNVGLKEVTEEEITVGKTKQKVLKFKFDFVSEYGPKIGKIEINGDLIFLAEESKVKEAIKGWKKDKNVGKELTEIVLNTIINKCYIEALILSKDVNLPPSIPLPKVSAKE